MEYVYAAMMLHSAGQEVTEEKVTEVLEAAGAKVDDARVKALVASLEDIDIDEAVESVAAPAAPAQAAPSESGEEKKAPEEAEEEVEEEAEEAEEEEEDEEEGAAGLGELFD